jgi:hypothetical protein
LAFLFDTIKTAIFDTFLDTFFNAIFDTARAIFSPVTFGYSISIYFLLATVPISYHAEHQFF